MKIIDNKKDYYDYVSGVNGVDPLAVYDRRGSVSVMGDKINTRLSHWFAPYKEEIPYRFSLSYREREEDKYFILEAGYMQYVFHSDRKDGNLVPELVEKRCVTNKVGNTPLTLIPVKLRHYLPWLHKNKKGVQYEAYNVGHVGNPILNGTFVPRFVPAEEIWNELCSYLLSVREKPITDSRNDVEKAESHGFDRKTSFRGK